MRNAKLTVCALVNAVGEFSEVCELTGLRVAPGVLGPLGLTIGSGAVILFDDTVDMWEVTRLVAEFFAEAVCFHYPAGRLVYITSQRARFDGGERRGTRAKHRLVQPPRSGSAPQVRCAVVPA